MIRHLLAFIIVIVFLAAAFGAGSVAFAQDLAAEGDESPATEADGKKDEKKSDSAAGDDAKNKDAKTEEKADKPEEKRKTHKLEPKRLKIDLTLDGTFVAGKMTEVPLRPDSWSEFEIVDVVELGEKVHKGQVL